jgi:hypothetical protein
LLIQVLSHPNAISIKSWPTSSRVKSLVGIVAEGDIDGSGVPVTMGSVVAGVVSDGTRGFWDEMHPARRTNEIPSTAKKIGIFGFISKGMDMMV